MFEAGPLREIQGDNLESSAWRAAGCALVGPSHHARGLGCDDAFGWQTRGDWLVACVADGAGSARFGGDGAAAAVRLVSEGVEALLPEHFPDDGEGRAWLETAITAAIEHARGALQAVADERGANLSDFHATLVGAATLGRQAVLFHIGDGAAAAMRRGDDSAWVEVGISPPENGEFINETQFLTLAHWRDVLRFTWVEAFDALLLMTDGVTPFALDRSRTAGAPAFVDPLLTVLGQLSSEMACRAIRNLLAREDVRAACDDDKTLVWIVNGGVSAPDGGDAESLLDLAERRLALLRVHRATSNARRVWGRMFQ